MAILQYYYSPTRRVHFMFFPPLQALTAREAERVICFSVLPTITISLEQIPLAINLRTGTDRAYGIVKSCFQLTSRFHYFQVRSIVCCYSGDSTPLLSLQRRAKPGLACTGPRVYILLVHRRVK
jgi:hypothetical protein